MLAWVAYALAVAGETRRARDFVRAARAAADSVVLRQKAGPELPVSIACALVMLGSVDDALRIAQSAATPDRITAVAAALARAGLFDKAEALADEISASPPGRVAREEAREQAKAFATLAEAVPAPRAQVLIGQALQLGNWEPCLTTLAKIALGAVAAIAEEASFLAAAG